MSNINFYQQPIPQQYPQIVQKVSGRWIMANTYAEVLNTPIPADGSQMFFFIPNEERLYAAYMDNGQKYIQGFELHLIAMEGQAQSQNIDPTEARIQNLENQVGSMSNAVSRMVALFEGSTESESNIRKDGKQPSASKNK